MKAYNILTDHLKKRSCERLSLVNFEIKTFNHASIIESSLFLVKNDVTSREQISYRLFYFKDEDVFGVFIFSTIIENGKAVSHTVISLYTTKMHEENFSKVIADEQYQKAAELTLSINEYKVWSKEKYGKMISLADHRLHVIFWDSNKDWKIKIRNKLCEQFKILENPSETLKHPGVLTSVSEQLKKFNKSLNQRKYMRYHSDEGRLKMTKLDAEKCLYCGMEPLETDVSAKKIARES